MFSHVLKPLEKIWFKCTFLSKKVRDDFNNSPLFLCQIIEKERLKEKTKIHCLFPFSVIVLSFII